MEEEREWRELEIMCEKVVVVKEEWRLWDGKEKEEKWV